eukprot:5139754-Pyramimonas_sp.AAC.1
MQTPQSTSQSTITGAGDPPMSPRRLLRVWRPHHQKVVPSTLVLHLSCEGTHARIIILGRQCKRLDYGDRTRALWTFCHVQRERVGRTTDALCVHAPSPART